MLHQIELKSVADPYFAALPGESPESEAIRRETARVDYKELMLTIVQRGAGQGFSMDDVEKGTRILRALRQVSTGQTLTLEDADYEYLLGAVRGFRYGLIDERILDFKNDLEAAPVVDPNAPAPLAAPQPEPEPGPTPVSEPEPAPAPASEPDSGPEPAIA